MAIYHKNTTKPTVIPGGRTDPPGALEPSGKKRPYWLAAVGPAWLTALGAANPSGWLLALSGYPSSRWMWILFSLGAGATILLLGAGARAGVISGRSLSHHSQALFHPKIASAFHALIMASSAAACVAGTAGAAWGLVLLGHTLWNNAVAVCAAVALVMTLSPPSTRRKWSIAVLAAGAGITLFGLLHSPFPQPFPFPVPYGLPARKPALLLVGLLSIAAAPHHLYFHSFLAARRVNGPRSFRMQRNLIRVYYVDSVLAMAAFWTMVAAVSHLSPLTTADHRWFTVLLGVWLLITGFGSTMIALQSATQAILENAPEDGHIRRNVWTTAIAAISSTAAIIPGVSPEWLLMGCRVLLCVEFPAVLIGMFLLARSPHLVPLRKLRTGKKAGGLLAFAVLWIHGMWVLQRICNF
jgi:Mn2+/Fe2+ NRAMP family transporter